MARTGKRLMPDGSRGAKLLDTFIADGIEMSAF